MSSLAQSATPASGTGSSGSITGFTITAGTNLCLIVTLYFRSLSTPNPTVTYNGDTVTQISEATGTGLYMWVGELRNPDTGVSGTVSASGFGSVAEWTLSADVYANVDQTTPVDGVQLVESAAIDGISATVSSAASSVVHAATAVNSVVTSATAANGSGQTQLFEVDNSGGMYCSDSHSPGAASVGVGWSAWGANRIATLIAFNVRNDGAAPPSITDVDEDNTITSTQTNVEIDGTSFDTATVRIDQGSTQVAQSIDSQTATAIQFDVVFDAGATDLKFGSATLRVTNTDTQFDTHAITIAAPSGTNYVNVGTPNPTVSLRVGSSPDLASGDQIQWGNVQGGVIGDVTVSDDGAWNAAIGVTAFDFRVWDAGDSTWGAWGTQTIGAVGTAYLFRPFNFNWWNS